MSKKELKFKKAEKKKGPNWVFFFLGKDLHFFGYMVPIESLGPTQDIWHACLRLF